MEKIMIYILIGIIVLLILLAAIYYKKKYKRPTNYKAFFIIGVAYIPLGIATENHAFTTLGIVFMVLGLVNNKKWKDSAKWSEMDATEKRNRILIVLALLLTLLAGIIVYFMFNGLQSPPITPF